MSADFFSNRLCFLHVGKTGGTTFIRALDDMVKTELICKARHMEELAQASSEELANYSLYRGHFWYGVKDLLPKGTRFITILRDPIQRARSTYDHIHRHPHGRHDIVKKMSFDEYIASDISISLEIDNWQTRVISGVVNPSESPDLRVAMRRLKEFPFVGLTECFEDSVALCARIFGWRRPSESRKLNITDAASDVSELSKPSVDRLKLKNSLDMKLYDYAVERFEHLKSQYRDSPYAE